MNQQPFFQLPRLSVIDVTGQDAATIVHNLTTNQVRSLATGQGQECFVTDVRGKALGHVGVYRLDNCIRLIGAAGQSERIVQHVDRYTIREDATPTVRDADFGGIVLSPGLASLLAKDLLDPSALRCMSVSIGNVTADLFGCRWLGEGSGLLLLRVADQAPVAAELCERFQSQLGDENGFHAARIAVRFPWFGIDLDETNLPQEASRDAETISFTKGCYLGQETVARLDAMGQVQKKLVAWSIDGGIPKPGTTLVSGDKTVGRLTSVAARDEGGAIAIGPARRSHFESGSVAKGMVDSESSEAAPIEVTATVL